MEKLFMQTIISIQLFFITYLNIIPGKSWNSAWQNESMLVRIIDNECHNSLYVGQHQSCLTSATWKNYSNNCESMGFNHLSTCCQCSRNKSILEIVLLQSSKGSQRNVKKKKKTKSTQATLLKGEIPHSRQVSLSVGTFFFLGLNCGFTGIEVSTNHTEYDHVLFPTGKLSHVHSEDARKFTMINYSGDTHT